MHPFWIALQFLSSVPVRLPGMPTGAVMGRSLLYYPLIGLLFGLALWLGSSLLHAVPTPLAAVLLLTLWVGLSGALHLDGLADSADAWLGGFGDRERTLAIMKDPRSGPMAVVALVLLLAIKGCAIWVLLERGAGVIWLVAPMLGRAALLGLFLTTPYVRQGGLGSALAQHLPRRAAAWVLLLCGVTCAAIGGFWAVAAVAVAFAILRRIMCRRLGGTTGDTAGALLELLEVVALLVLVWID